MIAFVLCRPIVQSSSSSPLKTSRPLHKVATNTTHCIKIPVILYHKRADKYQDTKRISSVFYALSFAERVRTAALLLLQTYSGGRQLRVSAVKRISGSVHMTRISNVYRVIHSSTTMTRSVVLFSVLVIDTFVTGTDCMLLIS